MLVALEHFELGQQLRAKPVLGDHSFDGMRDEFFRIRSTNLGDGAIFLAAFPAGVGHEFLFRLFRAGHTDFFRVDDHDKISGVKMRRIDGFVLAAQKIRDLNGEPTENRAVGINDVPFLSRFKGAQKLAKWWFKSTVNSEAVMPSE